MERLRGAEQGRPPRAHAGQRAFYRRPRTRRRAPASLSSVGQTEILNHQADRHHQHASCDHADVNPSRRRRVKRLLSRFEHAPPTNRDAECPAPGLDAAVAGCGRLPCQLRETRGLPHLLEESDKKRGKRRRIPYLPHPAPQKDFRQRMVKQLLKPMLNLPRL